MFSHSCASILCFASNRMKAKSYASFRSMAPPPAVPIRCLISLMNFLIKCWMWAESTYNILPKLTLHRRPSAALTAPVISLIHGFLPAHDTHFSFSSASAFCISQSRTRILKSSGREIFNGMELPRLREPKHFLSDTKTDERWTN